MAVDPEIITRSRRYADEVKRHFPVKKAVLFGSHAKGTATKDSDVDICFFLDGFDGAEYLAIMRKLMRLAYEYEEVFESVVYAIEDIHSSSRFVKEIIRTGVDVL